MRTRTINLLRNKSYDWENHKLLESPLPYCPHSMTMNYSPEFYEEVVFDEFYWVNELTVG